jgi:ApeA N-terminal domain 1
MGDTKLERRLRAGEAVTGLFVPSSADEESATPGVLIWSPERGAELELAVRGGAWPTEFDAVYTVHGVPSDGDGELSLLDARTSRYDGFDRAATHVSSYRLAVGAHVEATDLWSEALYRPGGLHAWHPVSGLSIDHPDGERRDSVRVEWRSPEAIRARVGWSNGDGGSGGGEVVVSPGRGPLRWAHEPGWSIETRMSFIAKPDEPATIDQLRSRFGAPLLGFVVFALDDSDALVRETYWDAKGGRGIALLQRGPVGELRGWDLRKGAHLFVDHDLPDVAGALARWFDMWHETFPALGLLRETIEQGGSYSAPRFLTLCTAAEGYWTTRHRTGRKNWSVDRLVAQAGVAPELIGCSKDHLALMGATREYHAHLGRSHRQKPPREGARVYTPREITDSTFESTRRLHAALQALLLRDLGLGVGEVERLLSEHYSSWPVP